MEKIPYPFILSCTLIQTYLSILSKVRLKRTASPKRDLPKLICKSFVNFTDRENINGLTDFPKNKQESNYTKTTEAITNFAFIWVT